MYGRGEASIAEQLGVSKEEAMQLKEDVYKALPKLKELIEKGFEDVRKRGYVMTLWGYKRRLPDFNLPETQLFYGKVNGEKGNRVLINTKKEVPNIIAEPIINKYLSQPFKKREDFIEKVKEEQNYILVDNRQKISAAGRQILNSRVQGCLIYETKVLDIKQGIVSIGDYVGQNMCLWDGEDWTDCWISNSGKKQLVNLHLHDGTVFKCSPNHQVQIIKHSYKGKVNKVFKEVKDLKKGERVLIGKKLPVSDFNLKVAREEDSERVTKNRHLMDLFDNSTRFKVGQFLGRLSTDGSISKDIDRPNLRLIFAEHEFGIIPYIEEILKPFDINCKYSELRENRTQKLATINIYGRTIYDEISQLDLKNKIHDIIWSDTEVLRGFLSGTFDGDAGISGNVILNAGGHRYTNEFRFQQVQKALRFFGIRSGYGVYTDRHNHTSFRLRVWNKDVDLFKERIGFINQIKQDKLDTIKATRDGKIFGDNKFLIVRDVEITDEYVDMYDVMDTKKGYFIADGLVTHNSSANMTKIALIKIYENEMLKKLRCYPLIPVHDEIIAISPLRYAKKTSELFAKDMEDAPKEKIEVDIKCDVEIFENWAGETIKELMDEELREEKEWKEV